MVSRSNNALFSTGQELLGVRPLQTYICSVIWAVSPTSPRFISSHKLNTTSHTWIFLTEIQSRLCVPIVKSWQFLGFSLNLIRFIFSIISMVSRRSKGGLETLRERWNSQNCFTNSVQDTLGSSPQDFLPALNFGRTHVNVLVLITHLPTYMLHHMQTAELWRTEVAQMWR